MKPVELILQAVEQEIELLESQSLTGICTRVVWRLQAMQDMQAFIKGPGAQGKSAIAPVKLDPIVRCRVVFEDGMEIEFSQPRALCQRRTIWVARDHLRILCQLDRISPDGQTFHFKEGTDPVPPRSFRGTGKVPAKRPTRKAK